MRRVRLVSLKPVLLNRWMVQGSVFDNDSICIILYHVDFNTSFVRYFDCEIKAHLFLTQFVYGDRDVSKESQT